MPRPKKGSPQYTVRFPEPLYSKIRALLDEQKRDASSFIREAVVKYMTEQEREKQSKAKK